VARPISARAALTIRQLHDARERGCQTASLQSTAMAERVYTAVGFRDLSRLLEYVGHGQAEGRVALPKNTSE
jgi:hypothetical protein